MGWNPIFELAAKLIVQTCLICLDEVLQFTDDLLKLWSLVGSGEGCQMRPLRYCASLLACGGSSETLCLARTLRDSVGRAKTTLRPVGIKMRDAGFARLASSGGML